ncbi:hypothetical protein K432DRAFT_123329 [Lepidopterella palustris CBS 459.81]|uniref:Uncharacterized protein n=1 Tax=Lepidopterella palustris CBS 459.81 TaxID=1314670 RepID=A0A8E2E525_9PEZI|nr:hypothetical protein K432DRAFT_123329 [Lepidopterella palustris CBS 459.81]
MTGAVGGLRPARADSVDGPSRNHFRSKLTAFSRSWIISSILDFFVIFCHFHHSRGSLFSVVGGCAGLLSASIECLLHNIFMCNGNGFANYQHYNVFNTCISLLGDTLWNTHGSRALASLQK